MVPVLPAPDDRTPSLVVVAAGGVGVLVMLAFVGVLALGSRPPRPAPGDRVAIVPAAGPAGVAVLVPRCGPERVTGVELRGGEGHVHWRITSRKGSIDQLYVVRNEPIPVGFDLEVALEAPPGDGPLTVAVAVDRPGGDPVTDEMSFALPEVPADGALYRGRPTPPGEVEARARSVADCDDEGGGLDLPVVAFALAAAVACVAYGVMVGRWWRGRGPT